MLQNGNLYVTNAKKQPSSVMMISIQIYSTLFNTLLYFVYYLPQQFIYTGTYMYLYKMCTKLFNTQTMLHVFFVCVTRKLAATCQIQSMSLQM